MRSSMRLMAVLATVAAIAAPVSFAQAQKKKGLVDQMSGQGYGHAGCGLGSVLFGAKPGLIQVVAATFNGTSGNQTFGITTGTLNCDIPEMGQKAAAFIELNGETVRKELARGRGETVESLAYILKCKDAQVFGDKMRENYGTILEDGISTYETTRRILKTIDANPELKTACMSIG